MICLSQMNSFTISFILLHLPVSLLDDHDGGDDGGDNDNNDSNNNSNNLLVYPSKVPYGSFLLTNLSSTLNCWDSECNSIGYPRIANSFNFLTSLCVHFTNKAIPRVPNLLLNISVVICFCSSLAIFLNS
jgi:hypothetical protein